MILSVRRAVPTVPSQAVQDGPDGYIIYVVKSDDTVERKAIEVASIQDGIAAVTQGLALGERVVVNGQFRLVNGTRVKAAPAAPGPSAADADGGRH